MQRRVWSGESASPKGTQDSSVLHPYLGYVNEPPNSQLTGNDREPLSSYGFLPSAGDIVRSPKKERVAVGIFGGSVAANFMDPSSLKVLADALHRIPRFSGKEIVFSGIALGGFKQPQMLLAYTYFLSLGVHFDVVIELDGFNDVTLAMVENVPKHVNPVYPREWFFISEKGDAVLSAQRNERTFLEENRIRLARGARLRPLKWSFSGRLLWLSVDTLLGRRLQALQMEMIAAESFPKDFAVTGPVEKRNDEVSNLRLLADVWLQSSLQMHRISSANGAMYVHFLQPNQYLPDSKPMSSSEKSIALLPASEFSYGSFVPIGYPLLQERGKKLRSEGVSFHDLTQVFKNHPEELYIDSCCHFSHSGSSILAKEMGRLILSDTFIDQL